MDTQRCKTANFTKFKRLVNRRHQIELTETYIERTYYN